MIYVLAYRKFHVKLTDIRVSSYVIDGKNLTGSNCVLRKYNNTVYAKNSTEAIEEGI